MNSQNALIEKVQELLTQIPIEGVMNHLTGSHPAHIELVSQTVLMPEVASRMDITAGLWLYVDDLDRSHVICQDLETPTGSLWHGILHRREGDYSNSRYWMRRAANHPLISTGKMDLNKLITAVEQSTNRNDPQLISAQKEEWTLLFNWCLQQA